MRLTNLSLPDSCRSATHALGLDVLEGALAESIQYDRAVAFFSSSVFLVAPAVFGSFFSAGGTMRLVSSPVLGSADIAAIYRALVEPAIALADLPRAVELLRAGLGTRAFAAWLAAGRIRMQIAIPTGGGGAIYHEKIGVFCDADRNVLAVSGSTNESRTAWSSNFERVDLFQSWGTNDARNRGLRIKDEFDSLWINSTDGLRVVPLHEALTSGILTERPQRSIEDADVPRGLPPPPPPPPELLTLPHNLTLFRHQSDAIREWGSAGGHGILAMATGAGKTLTALALAAKIAAASNPGLCIVLVAPYIHLVDQWCNAASLFGLRPIRAAEGVARWDTDLSLAVNAANAGQRPILSIAVTQATLSTSSRFRELVGRIRKPMLVIGDEVHNFGTRDAAESLPRTAKYRLGLSATPERNRDPVGTGRIVEYFGPVVYRYGLARAIREGVLTPYRYFPVRVVLEPDELDQYLAISKQLARCMAADDDDPSSDLAMRLMLKRARVIASARGKLIEMERILAERRTDTHIIVYCGDGQVEGDVPEESRRQVEAAVDIIGNRLRMKCASYTASTPSDQRQQHLKKFASGELQVLVAIRCLDEGVDIPSTRTAIILASSTNPRQFVQRRGRILRTAPGKIRADLFDLLACPELDGLNPTSAEYTIVRGMLRREFRRAAEFATLATNGPRARESLIDITERLELYDGWQETEDLEGIN